MYGDPTADADPSVAFGHDMPHYTRDWHFDPYHQALAIAALGAPAAVHHDTEWSNWEIFVQEQRGEHHAHVGTVHAPDAEMALVLAKENYVRRGPCVNVWVVPEAAIAATDYADADMFEHTTDKMYREPAGFQGLRKKAQAGREGGEGAPSVAASEVTA